MAVRFANARIKFTYSNEHLRRGRRRYRRIVWTAFKRERSKAKKQLMLRNCVRRAIDRGLYSEATPFHSVFVGYARQFYDFAKLDGVTSRRSGLEGWHTFLWENGFSWADKRFVRKVG